MAYDRKSVDAGLCSPTDYNNNATWGTSYCSLSSKECNEGFSFASSRQETEKQYPGGCLRLKATQGTKIGQCEDGTCASVKELCTTSTSFKTRSENCEVMMDDTLRPKEPPVKTTYGSCVSGGSKTCFWSFGAWCDDDDPSSFKLDYSCTCENVVVGACTRDDTIYCAVSEKSCDSYSEWVPPGALVGETGTKCFLCREPPGTAPVPLSSSTPVSAPTRAPIIPETKTIPPLPSPVFMPTLTPIKSPDMQTDPFFPGLPQENTLSVNNKNIGGYDNNANNNAGMVVGSICGGSALAAIMIIGLLFVVRRQNQRHAAGAMKSSADLDLSLDEKTTDQELI